MRTCRVCTGLCDSGDLIGDVCTDCIEEQREEEDRREQTCRMLKRSITEEEGGQLVFCYGK